MQRPWGRGKLGSLEEWKNLLVLGVKYCGICNGKEVGRPLQARVKRLGGTQHVLGTWQMHVVGSSEEV